MTRAGAWFVIASVLFGAAVTAIEEGVRAYVNDDRWDKALSDTVKTEAARADGV